MEISSITSMSSMQGMQFTQSGRKSEEMPDGFAEDMAAGMIEEEDGDGDGSLSIDELGLSEEDFAEIDTDGDGLMSSEEIIAAVEDQNEALREFAPEPPDMGDMDLTSTALQTQGLTAYQNSADTYVLEALFGSDSTLLSASV